MFGIFKRVAKLEQMLVMQSVDMLSIRKRLSSIESYHLKSVLRDTNRQHKDLFEQVQKLAQPIFHNGSIVAVGSGTIKPVRKLVVNAKPKVKKPVAKKPTKK